MNPAQKNKVDLSTMTEEEKKLFRLYGKIPNQKDVLGHKLKERKYFDSGDYALSKAGKADRPVGSEHPSPQTIPHSNPNTNPSLPVKESSLVKESTKEIGGQ
ncbi:hypothetical protein BZG36_00165 [Bifiguratus adelaidae]|uniref:mRNA stability protein n=1 Tax=Bifiguratus adelaidae TaxID=1938954 RepID=A0A261Y8J6_9FUNG|nr:hypothetical protein BZG36_00165 [Bifiguratus adelaidae]